VLTPAPVQARAVVTIARAVTAAAEILTEGGEDAVGFRAVSERSGVSSGSLLHHFGSLATLTAAAHAQRYEQALDARIAAANELLTVGGTQVLPRLLERFLAQGPDGSDGDELRRARMQTLSFARHHPALRDHLRGVIVGARDRLAPILTRAAAAGALPGVVDAAAVAVFHQAYTAGRSVDTLLDDPLPHSDWSALFEAVVVSGFTLPPPTEAELPTGPDDLHRLVDVLRDPAAAPGLAWVDAGEERVVTRARELLRSGGPDAVVVRHLIEDAGVSPGWFWRHFAGREELLDLLRLDALDRYGRTESEVLAELIRIAPSGERLMGYLAALVGGAVTADLREHWWDRVDLIVAASERDVLRREVAPALRAQLATVADAVRDAQGRGVVRTDLSADAMARFVWGLPVAALLGDVAGFPHRALAAFAVTTLAGLTGGPKVGRG